MPGLVMTVDNAFEIPGRGTVAVGTIEAGTVEVGERLNLGSRVVKCAGIERYRELLGSAGTGDAVGVLLADVTATEAAGQVLCSDPRVR